MFVQSHCTKTVQSSREENGLAKRAVQDARTTMQGFNSCSKYGGRDGVKISCSLLKTNGGLMEYKIVIDSEPYYFHALNFAEFQDAVLLAIEWSVI